MENKETKTAAPVAKSEEKATVAATKADVKETAKTVANEGKAPAAKKTGAAKTTKKAAAAKKTGAAKKKTTGKNSSVVKKVADDVIKTVLQFGGKEVETTAVQEKILNKFIAEGHRAGAIKQMEIYIVTEENKAYYVINGGKFDGNVDLF
ncbi:MAG: hypothetical protein J1D89_00625 [Agathobacter sp.]|nr:hypothetical protein [Agathobacter sp.]